MGYPLPLFYMVRQGSAKQSHGPFAQAAFDLYDRGLMPIPLGGEDGKRPLVKHGRWRRRPSKRTVKKWVGKHGQANVGILTGWSQLTVVDIDDSALVREMIRRFGDTPLKAQTPSGGMHLYYRSSGERSHNRIEGMKVDVKGQGGMVVVPPSTRPDGPNKGKRYVFHEGDWTDLQRLPSIHRGALRDHESLTSITPLRSVPVGNRNNMLLGTLLREAPYCDDFDQLLDVAETFSANQLEHDPAHPFTSAEIRRTARKAWEYETTGRNWAGREARAFLTASEIVALADRPDAFLLLAKLRISHGRRRQPFAISPKPMSKANVLPGWSDRRIRNARNLLRDRKFLRCVHHGGRGKRDPSRFVFTNPRSLHR